MSATRGSLRAWEPADWPVAPDWRALVDAFLASGAGVALGQALGTRLAHGATVYPPRPLRALELTALRSVRVVIVGQDPYHGPGQANGLAFSVAAGVAAPPSLRNILAEVARERCAGRLAPAPQADGRQARDSVDLARWARQGVLLLNTCLTVEQGRPASHAGYGWEALTGSIIEAVQLQPGPVAFLLWGRHAQEHEPSPHTALADAPRLVLRANHPSPLSARRGPVPFLGCGHFAAVNAFLERHGADPVDW